MKILRVTIIINLLWIIAAFAQDTTSAQVIPKAPVIEIDRENLPESALQTIPIDRVIFVKNTDLRDVFRAIAQEYNLNLIVDNRVSRKVTVRLVDLPVIDAIVYLCEENQLELKQTGKIFRIREPEKPKPPPQKPKELNISVIDSFLSVDLKGDELEKVIRVISQKSGENIIPRRGVRGTLNGFLQNVPFELGLRTLMINNGFTLRKKDGIYIIDRAGLMAQEGGKPGQSTWVSVQEGKISMDVVNTDVMAVLRDIAFQMDINMVTYGSPKGKITAKCTNITIEQAFNYLFKGTNFTYRKENDIYIVGDKKISGMFTTKLIRLKHIKADGIIELLPDEIKKKATLQVIKEQNGLMAIGSRDLIVELEDFINQIDNPTPQILIEALVVDFSTDDIKQLGVTLGVLGGGTSSDSTQVGNFSVFGGGDTQSGGYQLQLDGEGVNDQLRLLRNFFGVAKILRLPDDFHLRIQALEREGKANVRSRPQIATLNGHSASISIGTTQYFLLSSTTPIRSTTDVFTTESQRFEQIEANISLTVTPWVSASGEVTTEIKPEFKTPVGDLDPNVPPTINTRILESTVRLKDGETIILGGLIQEVQSDSYNKVPLLGDIPLLGRIFRNRNHNSNKQELVIYLTPHVFYGDEEEAEKWKSLKDKYGEG